MTPALPLHTLTAPVTGAAHGIGRATAEGLEANEIACVLAFLVFPLNTYITGQAIIVDGGFPIQ